MSYRIIADSSCDLSYESKLKGKVTKVPLILTVGDKEIIDDESLNQKQLIADIAACQTSPKSACPSPQKYLDAIEEEYADEIYIITLSSKLSGSFNSASLAKDMYLEEHEDDEKKSEIFVIDSQSASVGESRIAEYIYKVKEENPTLSGNETFLRAENFRDNQETLFVLDNLDTMRKNGRMSRVQAIVTSILNIKLVLAGDKGEIVKIDQARGIDKALDKMVDAIVLRAKNAGATVLVISHCNNYERAMRVIEEIKKKASFLEITVSEMSGLSTLYANDGGIIVCF